MRLCSLYSGSSGNCIYVGSDRTNLLIDVGVSTKKVVAALHSIDVKPEELDGILVTHEHSDHIGGLGVFLRKYGTPVYGTSRTLEAFFPVSWSESGREFSDSRFVGETDQHLA